MKVIKVISLLVLFACLCSQTVIGAVDTFSIGTEAVEVQVNYTCAGADCIEVLSCDADGIVAYTMDKNQNMKYLYLDYKGNVTEFEGQPVIFRDGVGLINKDTYYGYIDENGNWLTAPEFSYASEFSEGYGAVKRQAGKAYLLNASMEIRLEADDFYYEGNNSFPGTVFRNGYAAYSKDGKAFYLDADLNSTKIELGNECDFDDGEFMFDGGTLVHMYLEKINGEFTNRAVYRIFDHNGKETYRYVAEIPNGEELTAYGRTKILANGNVVFAEPEDYSDPMTHEKITLVNIDGDVLSETERFYRGSGKRMTGIGGLIYLNGDFYSEDLKNIIISDYVCDAVSADGSVAVSLVTSESDNITVEKIKVIKDKTVALSQDTKIADPNKIKAYSKIENQDVTVYINNQRIYFDKEPIIENNRTLVPMRRIFEELGAEVTWDNETQTAAAVRNGIEVKITIGSDVMYKNGEAIQLDAGARLIDDGYTFVPLRAVSEAFGCDVQWNEELQTVDIATK